MRENRARTDKSLRCCTCGVYQDHPEEKEFRYLPRRQNRKHCATCWHDAVTDPREKKSGPSSNGRKLHGGLF